MTRESCAREDQGCRLKLLLLRLVESVVSYLWGEAFLASAPGDTLTEGRGTTVPGLGDTSPSLLVAVVVSDCP